MTETTKKATLPRVLGARVPPTNGKSAPSTSRELSEPSTSKPQPIPTWLIDEERAVNELDEPERESRPSIVVNVNEPPKPKPSLAPARMSARYGLAGAILGPIVAAAAAAIATWLATH